MSTMVVFESQGIKCTGADVRGQMSFIHGRVDGHPVTAGRHIDSSIADSQPSKQRRRRSPFIRSLV